MQDIQDVIASYACYRRGRLTVTDWLRSLRGVTERAWYAADDPFPFVLMCLRMPVRAISSKLGLSYSEATGEAQPNLISR